MYFNRAGGVMATLHHSNNVMPFFTVVGSMIGIYASILDVLEFDPGKCNENPIGGFRRVLFSNRS